MNYRPLIQHCLAEFGFANISERMAQMGWEWYGAGVPSAKQLKEAATGLLEEAADGMKAEGVTRNEMSTGGLRAVAWENGISLTFEIHQWSSSDYE